MDRYFFRIEADDLDEADRRLRKSSIDTMSATAAWVESGGPVTAAPKGATKEEARTKVVTALGDLEDVLITERTDAQEAPALWQVYPKADPVEVEDLIVRLAEELRIEVPPVGDTVALPPQPERVAAALDRIEPEWRSRALLSPPDHPPVR